MSNVLPFPARAPALPPAPAPELPTAQEMAGAMRAVYAAVAALGDVDFAGLAQRIDAVLLAERVGADPDPGDVCTTRERLLGMDAVAMASADTFRELIANVCSAHANLRGDAQ